MQRIKKFLIVFVIFIIIFLLLFPLYIMLKTSLSTPEELFSMKPSYFLKGLTLEHFKAVLLSGESFWLPLTKSLAVALGATMFSLLVGIPAAYAVSRFEVNVRAAFLVILFASRMLPEVSIALPISISFIQMGLFDTVPGLILAHVIKILPVCCFMLVSLFAQFPPDLEKQALLDGCSRLQSFVKIVVPLSMTGITVAGLFSFLLSWDEFIYASYLTLAEPTMPLKMYYYVARGNVFYSATYAVIIMLPVFVITFIMQRHIRSEYLAGAMQG